MAVSDTGAADTPARGDGGEADFDARQLALGAMREPVGSPPDQQPEQASSGEDAAGPGPGEGAPRPEPSSKVTAAPMAADAGLADPAGEDPAIAAAPPQGSPLPPAAPESKEAAGTQGGESEPTSAQAGDRPSNGRSGLPAGEAGPGKPSRRQQPRQRPRPPASSSKEGRGQLPEATLLEVRVAQLWFWEGAWSRRSVRLLRYLGAEPLEVTDLDLVAYTIDAPLTAQLTIGEAKSGTGKSADKPLDRVIWLTGLLRVVPAAAAELTSAISPSGRVRRLGASLGVRAQSMSDLARREQAAGVPAVADAGAHGPTLALAWLRAQSAARADPELSRAYWYLRSEVFALDPWLAVKGVIALVRLLSKRLAPAVNDEEQDAVRLLLCEAVSVFTLLVVQLAATALTLEGDRLVAAVESRLSEGSVPLLEQRRLADAFDRYLMGLLAEAGVAERAIVSSLGAFHPRPPEYAETLADLLRRLGSGAAVARGLPRLADLVVFERAVRRRQETPNLVTQLGLADPEATMRALRLTVVFLQGQAGLPTTFADMLSQRQ